MSSKSFVRVWMPVAKMAAERLSRDDDELNDRIVAAILSGLEAYKHGTTDPVKLVVAIRGGAALGQHERQISLPAIPMTGAFADLEEEEEDERFVDALIHPQEALDEVLSARSIAEYELALAWEAGDKERVDIINKAIAEYDLAVKDRGNAKLSDIITLGAPDDQFIFAHTDLSKEERELEAEKRKLGLIGAIPYAHLDGMELCGEHEEADPLDDIGQFDRGRKHVPIMRFYGHDEWGEPVGRKSWRIYDDTEERLPIEALPRNGFRGVARSWETDHFGDVMLAILGAMDAKPTEHNIAWAMRYLASHLAKRKGVEPYDAYEAMLVGINGTYDLNWDLFSMSLESQDFGEGAVGAHDAGTAELSTILFPEEPDFEEELPDMEWKGHSLDALLRHIRTTGHEPWHHKVWLRAQVDSLARGHTYDEAVEAARAAWKKEQRRIVPTTVVAITSHGLKTTKGVLDWDTAQSHAPWLHVKDNREDALVAKCAELEGGKFFAEAFKATIAWRKENPRQ